MFGSCATSHRREKSGCIGVCDDMTRAYDEWYQFCTDNAPDDQVDEYLNSSTRMQRESFIAGAKMALALITGKEM